MPARSRSTVAARAALLVVTVLARPALAEAPCLEDAARLCPGIPAAGDGRLWACLQRNSVRLSSACVQNVQWVQARARELRVDCANDIYRFCPYVAIGQGRVLQCLGAHLGQRELSAACEEGVTRVIDRTQELVDACSDEAARFCEGVQPGGGRVFLCLRAQSERLSTRCRRALEPR